MSAPEEQHAIRKCEVCEPSLPSAIASRPQIIIVDTYRIGNEPALEESAESGCDVCSSLWQTFSKYYGPKLTSEMWFLVGSQRGKWDYVTVGPNKQSIGDSWQFVVSTQRGTATNGNLESQALIKRNNELESLCPSSCGNSNADGANKYLGRTATPLVTREVPRLLKLSDSQTDRFACLSHRWCAETGKASLKGQDLELFKKRIPQKRLYPLLRDAIRAVGELGLRCIIQDCEDDWNREAVKMASIYERAHITIAGVSSQDGKQGHFRRASKYISVEVLNTHKTQDFAPVIEMRKSLFSRSDSPLLARGWVFQESQLSRRFIYFTPDELTWDCLWDTSCECNACESSSIKIPLRIDVSKKGYSPWCRRYTGVVAEFSKLDLTYSQDRLPAVAGLASPYKLLNGDLTYAAGLWLESLADIDLFWHTVSHDLARPGQLFAPTWSWASICIGVNFRSFRYSVGTRISIQGCEIVPVEGGNEYGRLQKAHLRVAGMVATGRLFSYRGLAPDMVRLDGIEATVPFVRDYDLRRDPKYQVALGTEIFFLFGYVWQRQQGVDASNYGSSGGEDKSGTDSDDVNSEGLQDGYPYSERYPGGIVVRCVDSDAGYFERIGSFDLEYSGDRWEYQLGEILLEALRKARY